MAPKGGEGFTGTESTEHSPLGLAAQRWRAGKLNSSTERSMQRKTAPLGSRCLRSRPGSSPRSRGPSAGQLPLGDRDARGGNGPRDVDTGGLMLQRKALVVALLGLVSVACSSRSASPGET